MTGLDALAASLTTLEPACAFHGRLLQKGLAEVPRNYSALIWNLVHVLDKLEGGRGVVECSPLSRPISPRVVVRLQSRSDTFHASRHKRSNQCAPGTY